MQVPRLSACGMYLDYVSPRCELDVEASGPLFCMTLRLIIIHHHTKFGSKWFSDSGYIVRTKSDGRTGRRTDTQTDGVIQIYPLSQYLYAWGASLYNFGTQTQRKKEKHMFWNLFIFRGHSTRKPASVVCNDEQGDLFYSAGQHRNRC